MEKFIQHTGLVAALNIANIDTDAIIPKQFLQSVKRTGFGKHLFHDWRFLDDAGVKPNPEFILNQAPYHKASILLARENFGCGSSREHAPWALIDFGFKAIIAPSFADIFYNNSFNNGLLLIKLLPAHIDELFIAAAQNPGMSFSVDLQKRVLSAGPADYAFSIDEFKRHCLLNGLDSIGLSLRHKEKIEAFEKTLPAWAG